MNGYATLNSYTAQVTYGETFTLNTPEYSGSAEFYGWYLADKDGKATDEKVEDGKYLWAEDINLDEEGRATFTLFAVGNYHKEEMNDEERKHKCSLRG